jgi:chromate reductase
MITIISGTNRQGSNSLKISRQAEAILHGEEIETTLINLEEFPSEALNPSVYGEKPATLAPWIEAVQKSDGILVVIPEYNGSFPGVLKFFIDLLPFPESFDHRPVAFIGLSAGQFGGLRAVEQMEMVFGYRNAYLYPNRIFLPAVHQRLDDQGQLKNADDQQRLETTLKGFIAFCSALKV